MNHHDKCVVTAVASKKLVEADVMYFSAGKNLTVALNRSVKLTMTWNGKVYEGKSAGLDFESAGPKLVSTIRGA